MARFSRPHVISHSESTFTPDLGPRGDRLGAIVPLPSRRPGAPAPHSGPCGECKARVDARGGAHALTLRPSLDLALPALERSLAAAERILGSWDLAHDAAQEALIQLWQEPAAPPNPEAWLYKAVVNRALHARRTGQRRARHEDHAGQRRADAGADPARQLEVVDEARRLEAAIDELPSEFSAALRLREVQGLDYHAISRTLDVPVGTVRSRIHRARERLQADLASA